MRVLFVLLGSCALVFGLPLFEEVPEGFPEPIKASDNEPIDVAVPILLPLKDENAPEPRIGLDQAVPEFKIEKPAADSPVGLPHIYLDAPEIHSSNGPQKDYYQGDIALTDEQRQGSSLKRRKRQGFKDSSFPNTLWQVGTPVGYTIDSSLPARTAGLIRQALAYWSNHTCLTFQENGSGGSTKIVFFAGSGCWSYIGKVWYWGTQNISIGSDCQQQFGMISHEIGHALGLFHAQSRVDRDDFVTVQTQYITEDGQGQFSKESVSTNDNFGVKYDYGSVMHYSDVAFSNSPGDNTKKSIVAKEAYYQRTMGGRIAPAFSDVKVINSLYQCQNQCGTLACQNGGYTNPSNCNTCLCPWGFAGTLCDQRQEGTNGTCGQTLTATTSWQSLTKWVGVNDTVMYDTFNSCYWHIKSAAGTKVQIKVEFVGLVCSGGCFYGAVEFKMGEFTRTGNRFCCPEDYTGTPTLTSTSNLAVIGLHARYNLMYFVIQYKQV